MFYPKSLEVPSITEDELQFLHNQQITETSPGTILKDFQMLLDFIGTKGIEVSKTQNFLPMSCLVELNSRLTYPIQIELKRPQQKAYPHLHGLYFLLRASNISYVEPQGKKFFLHLEPKVFESWQNLNPTERYFNLLETWLIWGNEEILGERGFDRGLEKCLMFWNAVDSDKSLFLKPEQQKYYNFFLGLHQIALFSLFGLLEIESKKPKKGEGWQFKKIETTPWGNALFKLIKKIYIEELQVQTEQEDIEEEEIEEQVETRGVWQPQLQVFFPKWQHNLAIPQTEKQQGIYIFKVTLDKIWRRIAIPHDSTLYDLSDIILDSVDFDDDHLHEFSYKSPYGYTVKISHPYGGDSPFSDEFLVEDLSLKVGQTMKYLFDFGDNWQFQVQLESIESDNVEITKPTILASHGTAPEQYRSWEDEDEDEE